MVVHVFYILSLHYYQMVNKEEQSHPDFYLNEKGLKAIRQAARWARGLAFTGLFFIGGMAWLGIKNLLDGSTDYSANGASILVAVLFIFPTSWLFQYASRLLKGIKKNDNELLNHAFQPLAAFFKWLAISTGILVILYLIFLSITGVASLFGWGTH
ncbi:hypothetical protein BC349_14505 [Flavihumibacter stibioxidans]|uniref:Uncharacterized protein n=1 Tax=Flavihumibacter stibioxidans TaxID=1834163 RepID=A0ABR7MB80_9BACT|nr:hypothetical protein [Flavihumibacter stibioxidans]